MSAQWKNVSENMIYTIHQAYDSGFTFDEIARRLRYNPNYLSSMFIAGKIDI
ncbi:hypothetical protein J7E26_13760 [Bacillus sp. ISL-51]|nr:hypothetical protein [Bacillus sp. ISL-51]